MNDSREVVINCSCGGNATVKIKEEQTTAVTECACGKTLFWADDGTSGVSPDQPDQSSEQQSVLGIDVGDDVESHDKFGN